MHVTRGPRPTQLASYQVERLLGRGGMGEVYLAEDLRLKRKVALKVLSAPFVANEAFRERFLTESELAASIDHPNIVPIYEAGEANGYLFIAMRYVEGTDLRARLRDGPLSPAQAIDLLSQVASALDLAHARGLVHRDVKPSNVLVAPGAGREGVDHAYLADFGLTKRLSEGGSLSEDGQLMGTVDYVAPEQITGGGDRRPGRRLLPRLPAVRMVSRVIRRSGGIPTSRCSSHTSRSLPRACPNASPTCPRR